jgi:hypothetical protein
MKDPAPFRHTIPMSDYEPYWFNCRECGAQLMEEKARRRGTCADCAEPTREEIYATAAEVLAPLDIIVLKPRIHPTIIANGKKTNLQDFPAKWEM